MNSTIVLILEILILAVLVIMFYFVWRTISRVERGLKEIVIGIEKLEIGIFLLLVGQSQLSLPEIEKLGKELGLEEGVIGIVLKHQKLPPTYKPPELKTGDTQQNES